MRVAVGKGGPIKWEMDFQGPALDMMTTKNRNTVIRNALDESGHDWAQTFLPKRFTHYVERHPFPYGRHRLGFYLHKAKRMGIVAGIIQRLSLTQGWDPWSPNRPDFHLIVAFKQANPGKYNRYDQSVNLISDMRRNAKRAIMEIIDEMWGDGKFIPLVESGRAIWTALHGYRPSSVSTATKTLLKVKIPFGHAINSKVGATVRTVPHWEVTWIAKKFRGHMINALRKRGLSVGRGGVLTTFSPSGA